MQQGGQHGRPPGDIELSPVGPGSSSRPFAQTLRRQLAVSFSVVGAFGILLCGVLVLLVASVNTDLDRVREDAESTRLALGLSLAVREQYIHEAHTILEGNATHLHHHDRWVERAQRDASELEERAPRAAAGRARRVAQASVDLDAIFAERIVPAALAQDHVAIRRAHEDAESIARRAQEESANLVAALDRRGASVHEDALARSRLAVGLSMLGALCLLFLSAGLFVWLRRGLVLPLTSLAAAARAVTGGREVAAIHPKGGSEIGTVAAAFEAMTAQLRRRGLELVRAERMAALGELAQAVADAIHEPCDRVRAELRSMQARPSYEGMRPELEILLEEVGACHRIVDDLLAWAQAPELELEEEDMASLVHAAVDRFQSTELGATILVEEDVESCPVRLDAVRIRQVIANLLRNAAQASPGGRARVEGRARGAASYCLSISDDGPGVSPQQLGRLFEPFYTGHSGTGLGLAVCHGIIAAHGGRIAAEVGHDGGLCVYFELPCG